MSYSTPWVKKQKMVYASKILHIFLQDNNESMFKNYYQTPNLTAANQPTLLRNRFENSRLLC